MQGMDPRDLRDAHRFVDYANIFRETLCLSDRLAFNPPQPFRIFGCEDRGPFNFRGLRHQYPVANTYVGRAEDSAFNLAYHESRNDVPVQTSRHLGVSAGACYSQTS